MKKVENSIIFKTIVKEIKKQKLLKKFSQENNLDMKQLYKHSTHEEMPVGDLYEYYVVRKGSHLLGFKPESLGEKYK